MSCPSSQVKIYGGVRVYGATATYLLLGDAPDVSGNGEWIWKPDGRDDPTPANRLLDFLAMTEACFHKMFDRANLFDEPMPRDDRGRVIFPTTEARDRSDALINELRPWPYAGIVVIGKYAARAFKWVDTDRNAVPYHRTPYLQWMLATSYPLSQLSHRVSAVVIPHPSKVNPWWSSAPNRKAFARFAKDLI